MSVTTRDPARWIAIYAYAAFLGRQCGDDGEVRCAYCCTVLTPATKSLDHVFADRQTTPDRCVIACLECNLTAGRHNAAGKDALDRRLRLLGVRPYDTWRRVRRILREDLPDRSDPVVRWLAREWFGARLDYQRRLAAVRSERRKAA